ncbi:MAG: UDP-N-acetylmuramoyl-L-alanyl-D-glutamate--2,6-diaminopimelate ligase [Desulfosalsimonadaceae bacterium]
MKLSACMQSILSLMDRENSRFPVAGREDREVASVEHRSDRVEPGSIFVAIQGTNADGHDFIADAVSRGACAIVAEKEADVPSGTVFFRVASSRRALGQLASSFFGSPSEKMVMIGITGTNGKTTIAYLLEHILAAGGARPGVIGTINCRYGGKVWENSLTTPEATDLQRILADMHTAGVSHVVMEVSSHGLALDRVRGCGFDAGIFSNLSRDHLDFHSDMDAYRDAKKLLFKDLLRQRQERAACAAVINMSDPAGPAMAAAAPHDCLQMQVGMDSNHSVYPENVSFGPEGIDLCIQTPAGAIYISSGLVGRFNLENLLCAAAAGVALGIAPSVIGKALCSFSSVPGRLERISDATGRHVFVDYAHTPAALENVLDTLGRIITGRIICVFGCGGDRDPGKRPKMGEIAAKMSDIALITSDNPRSESPMQIIAAIEGGVSRVMQRRFSPAHLRSAKAAEAGYAIEPDREKGIFLAIQAAEPGDCVLIAGKGHEDYQLVGSQVLPFDDRETAIRALSMN